MKSEIHSQELIDKFKPLEVILPAEISFEERVEEIKNLVYQQEYGG